MGYFFEFYSKTGDNKFLGYTVLLQLFYTDLQFLRFSENLQHYQRDYTFTKCSLAYRLKTMYDNNIR